MSVLDREILALCREVSETAIMPRLRALKDGEIEDKGGNDPVTIADREAEELLREGLHSLNSGIGFIGEEGAYLDPRMFDALGGACWIVDPLDGTRNFARGAEPFGIIIAMADGGVTQSGWIYDCITGRFCAAHRGAGAFIDGERIEARTTGETPPVAALSLIFMDQARRQSVLDHIAPHYRMVDVPYCAAEQYPRVALGINDVSVFERTLPWDHAAGVLWLNEAGGKAARPDGSPYLVNEHDRRGLIGAASPALWEEAAARLNALP